MNELTPDPAAAAPAPDPGAVPEPAASGPDSPAEPAGPATAAEDVIPLEKAAPAESAPAPDGETAALLREVVERLGRLDGKFDGKVRNDAAREAVVDRLHRELQEYRADLLLNVLRPVLSDLIQLYDDIDKMLAACGEPVGEREQRLSEHLSGCRQEILDVLQRQGVEPFTVEGDDFNPRRQRSPRTTPAPHPDLEGKVDRRLRPGFARGETVLRPEIVVAFVRARAPGTKGDSAR
jgi:molecular chaperone GrpE